MLAPRAMNEEDSRGLVTIPGGVPLGCDFGAIGCEAVGGGGLAGHARDFRVRVKGTGSLPSSLGRRPLDKPASVRSKHQVHKQGQER